MQSHAKKTRSPAPPQSNPVKRGGGNKKEKALLCVRGGKSVKSPNRERETSRQILPLRSEHTYRGGFFAAHNSLLFPAREKKGNVVVGRKGGPTDRPTTNVYCPSPPLSLSFPFLRWARANQAMSLPPPPTLDPPSPSCHGWLRTHSFPR